MEKKSNISLDNGNRYINAAELTDDQVRMVLDWLDSERHDTDTEEEQKREYKAKMAAENAETDREWIDIYAANIGGIV